MATSCDHHNMYFVRDKLPDLSSSSGYWQNFYQFNSSCNLIPFRSVWSYTSQLAVPSGASGYCVKNGTDLNVPFSSMFECTGSDCPSINSLPAPGRISVIVIVIVVCCLLACCCLLVFTLWSYYKLARMLWRFFKYCVNIISIQLLGYPIFKKNTEEMEKAKEEVEDECQDLFNTRMEEFKDSMNDDFVNIMRAEVKLPSRVISLAKVVSNSDRINGLL